MASFFDQPYYKWNKIFLSCMGTWPEQTLFMRRLMPILLSITLASIVIPELIRLPAVWHEVDTFLDCLSPLLIGIMSIIQLSHGVINCKKLGIMLDHIYEDWKRIGDSSNIEILRKCADQGSSFTKKYSGCMYSVTFFYFAMPLSIPIIVDYFVPTNETREKFYFNEAEYGVNSDDYYGLILTHVLIGAFLSIFIIISTDTMLFVLVKHACAIFEIVEANLEMIHFDKTDACAITSENTYYKMICDCMQLHQQAIMFADLLESAYTVSLLGMLLCSLIKLSISGLQVLMNLNEPGAALSFASFSIAQIFRLYLTSSPGQMLMDHSSSILDRAYSIDWPDLSPRTQKLLIMIMIRSQRPCYITAGKIYIISMENYSSVMRKSASCFTVLLSML